MCGDVHRPTSRDARSFGACCVFLLGLALISGPLVGCASHASRIRGAREAYYAGDLAAAERLLEKAARSSRGGRDCAELDGAMVFLAQGDAEAAERRLRQVRDRLDRLQGASAIESGVSLLTDDGAVAYSGEDYERVMLRALLALSNLMHDGGDAAAYCLQVQREQDAAVLRSEQRGDDAAESSAVRVALGQYLHGVLQEESHRDYDEAARSFTKVVSWEPTFEAARFDLQRAQTGVHSAPGNGVVYVLTMVSPVAKRVSG